MSVNDRSSDKNSVTAAAFRELDLVCRDFEMARRDGQEIAIETVLSDGEMRGVPRSELLAELLAVEFELRFESGESPDAAEYLAQFPNDGDTVRNVLAEAESRQTMSKFAATVAPQRVPERFGEYRIVREIGRGGMGIVYEAHDSQLKRQVAVKVLPNSALWKPTVMERFRREAEMAAKLNHPSIVPIYFCGESDGTQYFVMRLISGRSLNEVISDWRSKSWPSGPAESRFPAARWVAQVGVQIADALDYAHQLGVAHRDIKPSNLILEDEHRVWVTDLGVAKLVSEESELTITGDLIGTLRYMSPEALDGQWGAAGDIYSLGVTLYELLTLQHAFGKSRHGALVREVVQVDPPRPRAINREVPRDLETVILKAMSKSVSDRYATAADLAADLRRFLNDQPVRARPVGLIERYWRWSKREPVTAGLVAAVFVVLSIGLFMTSWFYRDAVRANAASQLQIVERDATAGLKLIESGDPVSSLIPSSRALQQLVEWKLPDDPGDGLSLGTVLRWRIESVLEQTPAIVAELNGFASGDFQWEAELQIDPELYFAGAGRFLCQVNARTGQFQRWDMSSKRSAPPSYFDPRQVGRIALGRDVPIMLVEHDDGRLRLYDTTTDEIIRELENPFAKLGEHRFCGLWMSGNRKIIAAEVWCPAVTAKIQQDRELVRQRDVFGTISTEWYVWYGFLWDVETGRLLHTPEHSVEFRASSPVVVQFSDDGQRMMVRHRSEWPFVWYIDRMDWAVVLDSHNVMERAVRNMLAQGKVGNLSIGSEISPVTTLASDGRTAAIGTRERVALIRNLTPPFGRSISLPDLSRFGFEALADKVEDSPFPKFATTQLMRSPQAVPFLAAQLENVNQIHSYANSKTIAHDGPLTTLQFDASGRRLLTSSVDGTARLWNVTDETPIGLPMTHTAGIRVARFSPDNRFVATGGIDARVRIWESATGQPLTPPLPHVDAVASLTWSANGESLAALANDGTIRVWNLAPIVNQSVVTMKSSVTALSFSPDGNQLAAGSDAGDVLVLNLKDTELSRVRRQPARQSALPTSEVVQSLAWIANDRLAVIGGRRVVDFDAALYDWHLANSDETKPTLIGEMFRQSSQPVACDLFMEAARDRAFALLASRLLLIETPARTIRHVLHRELSRNSWIDSFSVSTNGLRVVTAQNQAPNPAQIDQSAVVRGNFLLPDDDHATIHIRNAADGQHQLSLQTPANRQVRGVQWRPNGDELVAYGEFGLMAWNGITGDVLHEPDQATDGIRSARFSLDGQHLMTVRHDNQCLVRSGQTFLPTNRLFRLPDDLVLIDFLSDGKTLITVTSAGQTQIWDWRRGEPVTAHFRVPNRTRSATLNHDRTQLALGGQDGSIRLWNCRRQFNGMRSSE